MRPSVDYPEPPLTDELPIDYPAGTRWGAVLSHDIDHLGLREHLADGFLLRYAAALGRDHLVRRFRPGAFASRAAGLLSLAVGRDPWDTIADLLDAERRAGVRSSWYFAVRRGTGIAYGHEQARVAMAAVREAGHEIGLHGQSPDDGAALADEVADAARLSGVPIRGIRMHYLRLSPSAFDGMSAAGLRYDSTIFDRAHVEPDDHPLPGPRLVRPGLLELPLHVMDSTLFSSGGLGLDAEGAIEYTRRLIDRAARSGRTIVFNLHNNTYSRQNPDGRRWYDALLRALTTRSDVFLTDAAGLADRVRIP